MHRAIVFSFCLGILVPPALEAQYFGRNKVQYESFDFRVMRTDHFDIYYYPEEEQAVSIGARMAERWYARLAGALDYDLPSRQPLILYASQPHFQQTNAIPGFLGEGTGGVTESLKGRIVLPFAGPLQGTDHVLGHELVHAFQYAVTGVTNGGAPVALQLPLWFIEGMAEYLSLGPVDAQTAMWLREAARRDELPAIRDLNNPRFFPYRYGHALWAFLAGEFGDRVVGQSLKAAAEVGNAIEAIEAVTGVDAETLSERWHASIRDTYAPVLGAKTAPAEYGRALITSEGGGGEVNVGPALSPDGRWIVFLSERGLFSIEMFLADAETGEVTEKIVETAADPHFESLQFIQSSGSWDAEGRRFVFGAIREGQPVLVVLDVESGDREREIRISGLGEIFDPTWSPDGRRIAFSAIAGGLTDLYVYDVEADELRRLTEDPFTDIQPSWSPDGARIAFATDRFTTDLETLAIGQYQLAAIDPRSGDIERLPSFQGAKNIDPSWGAGGDLYFLSDAGGITNIYRLDVENGGIFQITDLLAGVSGITNISPALSAASDTGRLAFSAYQGGEYHIYTIDSAELLAGVPVASRSRRMNAAILPPAEREGPIVARMLDRPAAGLPERQEYRVDDYNPGLSLDYIGQPYLVAGADRFGQYLGGGISFFWSDMLGNHNLGTQLQINGEFEDFAGVVGYQNLSSRWTWGGAVQQIPFVTGSFRSGVAEVDGQPAFVEESVIFRQTERQVSGVVAYPFSRSQRIEFTGGFRNISFDRELETRAVSLQTGNLLIDQREELPSLGSLNLGEASAALVYDTSITGLTSPVLGTRYRFEGGASAGGLNFSHVLADYRRYFVPLMPFTIAGRVLHFGRYGGDAEDERFRPLFVGYQNLVRGYEIGSFSASECVPDAESNCPVFDQLLGSRIAVANLEFRFPLLGALGAESFYGPLPIELAFFADAGVAWTSDVDPSFFGGARDPVTSAGVALRFALQRFLILEFDLVRPFDRPQEGWIFQFGFQPGF